MSPKKFRAYYKGDFDTSDGALKFEQKLIDDELWFYYDGLRYRFEIPFMDNDWIIQQYLGFKDENGVEVFEGDIVKYTQWWNECDRVGSSYTKEVKFSDGVVYPKPYYDLCDDDPWYSHGIDNYQIIGNIFENPELIEKK